jgi:cytochrome c
MHRSVLLACATLALAACGSKAEDPVEQIVVRKPGETAAAAAVPAVAGDLLAKGKAAFAACSSCHAVEAGAAAGIGPNLNGVVGRKAGSLAGFAYSEAMAKSGITWTEDELNAFLANPSGKVPGTAMAAGKVADAERRAAVVAYLASLKN